ncbi:MAG: ATP-binding cassette domain-containing protein [Opitutaceae bacterium]
MRATSPAAFDESTVIEASGLRREFRQYRRFPGMWGALRGLFTREHTLVRAVDGIDFSVQRGEAVGYLGQNGAGKSTTIKMLCGILMPTAGHLRVLGRIPHKARRENARRFGAVFGQRSQLWWDLPLTDSFDLHRLMYHVPSPRFRENVAHYTKLLDLTRFLDRPVRQLSLGERMRAELAIALLHDPEIVFLDEPTIGLDVIAKDAIREALRTVNRERGVTLIVTSHDLQDIEHLCPRIVLIHAGRLVFNGTLAELKARLGRQRRIKLTFADDPGDVNFAGARLERRDGRVLHFVFERGAISPIDVLAALPQREQVIDLSIEEPGIEQVLRTFYRGLSSPVSESAQETPR